MPKKAKQTTADIHRAVAQKVIAAMETHGSDWAKSWAVPQGRRAAFDVDRQTLSRGQLVNTWHGASRRRFRPALGHVQAMAAEIDGRTSSQGRARRDGDPAADHGER